MFKINIKLILVLFIILLYGCSAGNVTYDYDHTIIFSDYKTYDFLAPQKLNLNGGLFMNTAIYKKVQGAVNSTLRKKGFSFDKKRNPDFIIMIHINLVQKDSLYKFYKWWQTCGTTSVSTFENNSLVIDVIDKNYGLIWRGLAKGFFNHYQNDKNSNDKLNNIVASILHDFPPS